MECKSVICRRYRFPIHVFHTHLLLLSGEVASDGRHVLVIEEEGRRFYNTGYGSNDLGRRHDSLDDMVHTYPSGKGNC